MSELVMRKIDGKNKLFKKTVKKCDDKEEKGEKHDSAKEEKAEKKEHKEHPEFSKKTTDQIAHDHIREGKEDGQEKDDPGENSRAYHTESMKGRESRYGKKEKMGKGGGGGMDRAHRGLNDWFDKHEGKEEGSSNKGIEKERKRQGYDKKEQRRQDKIQGEPTSMEEKMDKLMGKGGGGGVRHGKKAKKLSFAAYSAKKWEKK